MEGPALLQDSHNNNTRLGTHSPDTLKMSSAADIEQFQGKIVYNPDGSAYIMEDADFSDDEGIDLPKQVGRIVDKPGHAALVDQFPTIENAIYVARSKSLNNYPSYVRAQASMSDTRPSVHSYRVYNYRQKATEGRQGEPLPTAGQADNIPVKPILMCFICKLSFGNTKAFKNHCKDDHSLEFNDDECDMLAMENISALVQLVGKDKEPLLSFLEPVVKGHYSLPSDQVPMRSPSKSPTEGGHIRVRNDLAGPHNPRGQISPVSNGRSEDSMSPSPNSFNPSAAGSFPLKGTTIGACPEHTQGRPNGVDCAKCDMIINTNRLGQMGWNASNNACKTLKCPKCNWHYKYQETLEIHMKEKHPESETTCIYCITGQQHPRLARGETYTCGYKPYRCEICNYSTTTKGNLSIHMQSDKHINNMQELQNGGIVTAADGTKISQSSLAKLPMAQRLNPTHPLPQPSTWRCDVCNYETSLPRNLRIHMTSDKHVQAITTIQQNMKQLQGLQMLQSLVKPEHGPPQFPPMPGLPGPMGGGDMNHMMMMDFAHNQAMFLQLMATRHQGAELGQEAGGMEGPADGVDPNPTKLFSCCVCQEFGCDSLEGLAAHLAVDRSLETGEGEVTMVISGTHVCKLCTYKTNLKANFQLHSKTDKHLARLSLFNHIREGGPANEWKLNMLAGTNPTQLRCSACDYNTNSLHKLQAHAHTPPHDAAAQLFGHLCGQEAGQAADTALAYTCVLCRFAGRGKAALLQHARSLPHLRAEQVAEGRRQAEGGDQPEVGDIFTVEAAGPDGEQAESSETESQRDRSETSPEKEQAGPRQESGGCPLCQEPFTDSLEDHAREAHQVSKEGLGKLASLMEGCQWLNRARADRQLRTPSKEGEEAAEEKMETEETVPSESERSPIGAISERHVYKYRCAHCSLAFKTQDKLETHAQYHQFRDSTKCRLCERNFRTIASLLKHLDTGHPDTPAEELALYRQALASNPLLRVGLASQVPDSGPEEKETECLTFSKTDENERIMKECLENIAKQGKKVDKILTYPMEKYLDPNRPFKCDVCKESFTQKNILLVHFNSVSHLHRLKNAMKEQGEPVAVPLTPQSEKGSPQPGSTLLSVLGSLNAKKQLLSGGPEEERPYKCNICSVQYGEASALDIHIRSGLHSGRAARLQQLVAEGQVDLNKPLIEQPDMEKTELRLLSPQSNASNSSNSPTLQKTPGAAPNSTSPFSTPQPLSSTPNFSQSLSSHRSLTELFSSNPPSNSDSTSEQLASLLSSAESSPEGKKSSPVMKTLLQNYGFDLVMQFNEGHQRRRLEERLRQELQGAEEGVKQEGDKTARVNGAGPSEGENITLPEVRKSRCPLCQKEFSSIWVLKAHTEEVHKVVVPPEFLQKYVEELRLNMDADQKDENKSTVEMAKMTQNVEAEETDSKAGETPLLKTTEVPEEAMRVGGGAAGLQQMMREALRSMQEQNQNSFPGGPHSLINMNLHPPLIPPGMVQHGADPFTAALLAMQAANQHKAQNTMTAFENQILTKLGIDPEVVTQAGLDPKLLIHLANMDPKAALDPKVLAMMTSKQPPPGINFQNQKMRQLAMENKIGFFPGLPQPIMSHQDPKIFNIKPQQFVDHGQKRARTRITDDQLKVLRSNFDINNSPSEEQTNEMASRTGLPPKVIKHWFRNTLFKERQKNKDSPYNFNNPPSTLLNLEEYEKTGVSEVIHLSQEEQREYTEDAAAKMKDPVKIDDKSNTEDTEIFVETEAEAQDQMEEDNGPPTEAEKMEEIRRIQLQLGLNVAVSGDHHREGGHLVAPFDAMFPPGQMGHLEKHPLLQSPLGAPPFPGPLGFIPPGHPFASNIFDGFGGMRAPSPALDHPGLAMSPNAKRANRTRFTDYQIKVLQEFFENNAYPKDDDLEYLSKLLSLSPRVIVVWFQNARQKARKIYENQPSLDPDDEGAGRFTRTPGLNYQCKKCLLVFQRYYELIRHQKQHCFKEEDAKRSAQAQKAAAHAAASFVGQAGPARSEPSQSPGALEQAMVSPLSDIRRSCDSDENKANQAPLIPIPFHRLLEEKKTFGTMFEKFSQEERVIKFINDASNQMASGPGAFPVTGPFAMLQKQAAATESAKFDPQDSDDQSMDSFISSPTSKRKMSDDTEECVIERDENGQPKDKRLRTTILPEQLDYLYQKYQLESNPSRKMLEQIAAEVGLRKRVVQVWFQNTRARERKGQFRAHQQVINKRCPFCPALFKVRSALESHLATKHASQYTRGDINIDSLPDAGGGEDCPVGSIGGGGGRSTLFPSIPCPASPPPGQMPPLIPNNDNSSDFEANMRKYYEDTMKQFISDVSLGKQGMAERSFKPERSNEALDLSSPPLKHNNRSDEMPEREEARRPGQAASPGIQDGQVYDFEEDRGGASDNGVEGYHIDLSGAGHLGQQGFDTKKRYRTQMSTVQVKLMKHVFELHKTPSMSECLALAQLIGLQKRVVQVWFQNARAKEKKARLNLQQITGKDAESAETPVECKFCSRQYQNKFGIQEHIFDREHLDNVRKAIEAGNYEPETPGYSLNQKASALYKANNSSEETEQRARTKEEPPPPLVPSGEVPSYRAPRAQQYDPEGQQQQQQQQQYRAEQQPAPSASYPEFPGGPTAAYPPAPAYPRQQYDQYTGYIGSYHGGPHYPAEPYPGYPHTPAYEPGPGPGPGYTLQHPARHYPHMYPAGK